MNFECATRWERMMIRLFGRIVVDERGRFLYRVWRGKPYFRITRD